MLHRIRAGRRRLSRFATPRCMRLELRVNLAVPHPRSLAMINATLGRRLSVSSHPSPANRSEELLRSILCLVLLLMAIPVRAAEPVLAAAPKPATELIVPDVVKHAGLTPEEAVKAMNLPP